MFRHRSLGLGSVTSRYFLYLLGQMGVCVGALMEDQYIYCMSMLTSAMGLLLVFITAMLRGESSSRVRGMAYSAWIWIAYLLLAGMITVIKVVFGEVPMLDYVPWCVFCVASVLACFSIGDFHFHVRKHYHNTSRCAAAQRQLWTSGLGFFGAIISIVSCVRVSRGPRSAHPRCCCWCAPAVLMPTDDGVVATIASALQV
jgi:hypothetical protein